MASYKLNYLHLADGASVDNLGKVNVFGIFGRIFLEKVPTKFLKFTIVGNIMFEKVKKQSISVGIKIFDSRDEELEIKPLINLPFNIPEDKKEQRGNLNFIIEVGNLEFKSFGQHRVVVYLDGEEVGSQDFLVEERK